MGQQLEVYPDARGGLRRTTNELVLPKGEFAYTRDNTNGVTSVRCGPCVVNAQAQDEPVVFEASTGRFKAVSLAEAAQVNTTVPTGHYAVLLNPSAENHQPEGSKSADATLLIGQRIHMPGPTSFALWPRQAVKVIEGHQLRSNQYLLVRVYDELAAKENWGKAIVKKATEVKTTETTEAKDEAETVSADDVPDDLSVGKLLIIRGNRVSFYIPPTGIEVVPNEQGRYVREALTLERLQYCILVDENGNKRYVRGPDVVFPLPTERFHMNVDEERLFRPTELNGKIQGLHIKIIAAYTDEEGVHGPEGENYKEGDELFITGETTPIYFPCEQHSAIRYDGKTKHFATAIPAGDGRYVLDRHTGTIRTVSGEDSGTMYLPDPRKEVFCRRVLSDAECESMYPGNAEALVYNRALREIQARTPTTRKGVVSDGDLLRARISKRGLAAGAPAAARSLSLGESEFADASYAADHTGAEMGGDEFTRQATYSEPRTLTMGSDKFSGVPKINPWTGFAVMVVDTAGNRRVEVGPKRVLLDFNETLETLTLSTGKPKTTDHLLNTAYLQVNHNKVTDTLTAETTDHVTVDTKIALRVNFEGDDPTKWFAVSNYVKLLCDHVRSILKSAIRKVRIEEFWPISEDFIRDTILGKKEDGKQRAGMLFPENGMRVYDVEVLKVVIGDEQIQRLLVQTQHETVETSISLAQDERRLEANKRREELRRMEMESKATTSEYQAKLNVENIVRTLGIALAEINANIEKTEKTALFQEKDEQIKTAATIAELGRQKSQADMSLTIQAAKEAIRLDGLAKETEATVRRLTAVGSGFSEALLALGNQDTLVKVAEAMSVQSFIGGKDLVSVLQRAFAGTPLEKLATLMQQRAGGANGNGGTDRALPATR